MYNATNTSSTTEKSPSPEQYGIPEKPIKITYMKDSTIFFIPQITKNGKFFGFNITSAFKQSQG